jgi:hypothetical protein
VCEKDIYCDFWRLRHDTPPNTNVISPLSRFLDLKGMVNYVMMNRRQI